MICLCQPVGPYPPNGYNPLLREGGFFCSASFFRFVYVYWIDFFVLTCLLLYVLEFVYIATLGQCANRDKLHK
jgi:hypothetical protein